MNTKHARITILEAGFVLLLLSLLVISVPAAVYRANGTEIPSELLAGQIHADSSLVSGSLEPGEVIFFTNSRCEACHDTETFLDEFSSSHPSMNLKTYDLFSGTENRVIFTTFKDRYHRDHLSTPSVIAGNLVLEGGQDIRKHLGEILSQQQKLTIQGGD